LLAGTSFTSASSREGCDDFARLLAQGAFQLEAIAEQFLDAGLTFYLDTVDGSWRRLRSGISSGPPGKASRSSPKLGTLESLSYSS
jgi:hypothetical protein